MNIIIKIQLIRDELRLNSQREGNLSWIKFI